MDKSIGVQLFEQWTKAASLRHKSDQARYFLEMYERVCKEVADQLATDDPGEILYWHSCVIQDFMNHLGQQAQEIQAAFHHDIAEYQLNFVQLGASQQSESVLQYAARGGRLLAQFMETAKHIQMGQAAFSDSSLEQFFSSLSTAQLAVKHDTSESLKYMSLAPGMKPTELIKILNDRMKQCKSLDHHRRAIFNLHISVLEPLFEKRIQSLLNDEQLQELVKTYKGTSRYQHEIEESSGIGLIHNLQRYLQEETFEGSQHESYENVIVQIHDLDKFYASMIKPVSSLQAQFDTLRLCANTDLTLLEQEVKAITNMNTLKDAFVAMQLKSDVQAILEHLTLLIQHNNVEQSILDELRQEMQQIRKNLRMIMRALDLCAQSALYEHAPTVFTHPPEYSARLWALKSIELLGAPSFSRLRDMRQGGQFSQTINLLIRFFCRFCHISIPDRFQDQIFYQQNDLLSEHKHSLVTQFDADYAKRSESSHCPSAAKTQPRL